MESGYTQEWSENVDGVAPVPVELVKLLASRILRANDVRIAEAVIAAVIDEERGAVELLLANCIICAESTSEDPCVEFRVEAEHLTDTTRAQM